VESLALYKNLEEALDCLQRPVAIVCADMQRAGLVFAAYKVFIIVPLFSKYGISPIEY
jgi:hypothetical protein